MTTQIIDATGKRYGVGVTAENQLKVLSSSVAQEGVQAAKGNSFIVHYECHLAAASSGGLMAITNNEADYVLDVTRIYIDPHVLTPTDLIVTQVYDPTTITNGTNISTTNVIQKNRGKPDLFNLSVVASSGSSDMTFTGGTQFHAFGVKSMESIIRDMQSTNVLYKNNTLCFGWKRRGGGNATDGEIISLSVNVVKLPKE